VHGRIAPAERRSALLGALREAGFPVSVSGDREVRAAEAACRMVKDGANSDDLGRRLADRYPLISDAKARELAEVVISTYCRRS
jgi:Protein of unknown function (DUF732)